MKPTHIYKLHSASDTTTIRSIYTYWHQFRLHSSPVKTLFSICSDFSQHNVMISFSICSDFIQHLSDFIQHLFRLHSGYVQTSFSICKDFIQHMLRLYSEPVQTSFSICSGSLFKGIPRKLHQWLQTMSVLCLKERSRC